MGPVNGGGLCGKRNRKREDEREKVARRIEKGESLSRLGMRKSSTLFFIIREDIDK